MTDAQPTPRPSDSPGPSGFSGWLLVPAFFTVITPWFFGKGGVDVVAAVLSPHMAAAPGPLRAVVWFEAAANAILLAAWIYAIVLMLTRRASFPRLFVVLAVASFAFVAIDTVMSARVLGAGFTADDGVAIARQVAFYLAWIPYMLSSSRVRNTFVR